MSSSNKKWFLFVNLLFSLTLSNNLLATEKANHEEESGINPDSDSIDAKKSLKNQESSAKNVKEHTDEISLAELIEREEKLMRHIAEASILAEEIYIEETFINAHFEQEILAEELFLQQLEKNAISSQQFLQSALSDTNQEINKQEVNLGALELSIDAIYRNNSAAQEKAAKLLKQSKRQSNHLSRKKLGKLNSKATKLVRENIALLKLANIKTAASNKAHKEASIKRKHIKDIKNQQRSLDKLLKMKNAAAMLAAEKSNSEAINEHLNKKNDIVSIRFKNSKTKLIAGNINSRKNNIEKLSAMKETIVELYSEQITDFNNSSVDLKVESDKLEKLSSLKSLQAELAVSNEATKKQNSIGKLISGDLAEHANDTEAFSTSTLQSYLNSSNISFTADDAQNYVLEKPKTSAHVIPENLKQITENKNVNEKIDFGVTIGKTNNSEPNDAELEDINSTIAPDIESIEFDPEATELLLVDSKMNKKKSIVSTLVAFNEKNKQIYAPAETLKAWEILPPYPDAVEIDGHNLIPLHSMHSVVAELDRSNLSLNLSAPTEAFSKQILLFNPERKIAKPNSDLGLYLNYDTLYTKSENSTALSSVLLSPVVFSKHGYFSNRFRYLSETADNGAKFTRIESYFQKDFPERLTSLRIGDNISSSGAWGRSSAFTGIQYGTNFSTQPEFLSTPLPSLFSETSAPSTVDIYINDRLARNINVNPGPFEIRNIPPLNGNGQIQFVIRDELGRERIVTTDFYANNTLLRPGVSDYSINLGVEREDIGRASANYGSALGVINYRRGITNTLTLGSRGEFSEDTNNIGVSANYTLGNKGTLEASAALSKHDSVNAALWRLGYRYSRDQFSIATTYQKSDDDFRFLGQNSTANLLSQVTLSTGYNSSEYGSIGLSHVRQNLADNKRSVNSLSYAKTFQNKYSLGFYASHARDSFSIDDMQYGLTFSTSFNNGGAFSSSWSKTGSQERFNNTYQRSSQELLTPSYRINTTSLSGAPTATDIDVSTRTQYFDVDARINQRNDNLAHQVGAYGSFALLRGGYWGFTRDISDSFAVVKVADFENVGVYQQNRFIGRTNSKGYLIAPDLAPYLENTVRFDPVDVPLDTTFKTEESQIVPYSKSGVLVDFKIEKSISYSFTVVDKNGNLLKLGTNIKIGDEHNSIVGYDGLVFVQVPNNITKLDFGYASNSCEIQLPTHIKPHKITGIITTEKLVCK